MKKILLFSIACLTLFSCNQTQRKTIERDDEPDLEVVENDDKKMNEAIALAGKTLDQFDKAFKSGNKALSYFSIKMRFDTPKGGEHIWMSDIDLKDGKYFGAVGNVPEQTNAIKLGDVMEIPKDRISDWMYTENGKLRGGYTIRAIRERMSKEERKQFDQEMGMVID